MRRETNSHLINPKWCGRYADGCSLVWLLIHVDGFVVLILVTRGVFFKVRRSVGRGEGGYRGWILSGFIHQSVACDTLHVACRVLLRMLILL